MRQPGSWRSVSWSLWRLDAAFKPTGRRDAQFSRAGGEGGGGGAQISPK